MLAIRMQRTGRKGHAMFRVVVQDSRRTPTSGKIVASIGNYDPHAKTLSLDKEKVAFYLEHGAQPSDRAARLLKNDGVKLPSWVALSSDQKRAVRNPDKRRSTRPAEPKQTEEKEPVEAEVPTVEATKSDAVVETTEPENQASEDEASTDKVEEVKEAQKEPEAEKPVEETKS